MPTFIKEISARIRSSNSAIWDELGKEHQQQSAPYSMLNLQFFSAIKVQV